MSLQRTPPRTTLISESGGGSGSVPNLSTYGDDSFTNINFRKRKERSEEQEYKKDFEIFRSEIMSFFKEFAKTQNENLSNIKEELSEIKGEIKTIKSATENFAQQLNQINNDIENLKSNNTTTQEKIKDLEKEISLLKCSEVSHHSTSKTPPLNHENLILELKERSNREKNIVIVGILEKNDKNYKVRQSHDMEAFIKLATLVIGNCPTPTKTMRLGKYVADKHRPLKICFDNNETPKILLRNKAKFPEDIKIYSDQTPAQYEYLQSVKEELERRSQNGEKDLTIKYFKGIPRIIVNKVDQKN